MLVGVFAQGIGRHARIPGIVLLLIAGVGLGPDGANLIRPHAMGGGLAAVVGFAVALILFEGGLGLELSVLRAQATMIRRLVTIGALVTAILATLTVKLVMGWDFTLSILFGTLVIVTGPTVVTPLVRRLRLSPRLTTILIAEGIFIDAVGATVAVVALEIVLASNRNDAAHGVLSIFTRFGVGAGVGVVAGALLVALLKVRRVVPHGIENVLVLATAFATYHVSGALVGESGITAAIIAGLVVGNAGIHLHHTVVDFSEQLTTLFVATLFVLLAADVRLADVRALGAPGWWTVALLMLVVRPATVFASAYRTGLSLREKLYLSWVAPRGIVAAAVASLFAIELADHGVAGGVEMRALVFVVIATTVTVQGLSASVVARLLEVRLPNRAGYLFLGANGLSLLVARVLQDLGETVTLLERSEAVAFAAREAGFIVVQGDALQTRVLESANIASVAHVVGMTTSENVNLTFARAVRDDHRGPTISIVLEKFTHGVTPAMVQRFDMQVLFAAEHDLLAWLDRVRQQGVVTERWRLGDGREVMAFAEMPEESVLPIALVRNSTVQLITHDLNLRGGEDMVVAIATETYDQASAWLSSRGWTRVASASRATPLPGGLAPPATPGDAPPSPPSPPTPPSTPPPSAPPAAAE